VVVVGAYLLLNLVVVGVGLYEVITQPQILADWQGTFFADYGNPWVMIGVALLVFPKLALGVSGFETGVSVMPLVRGDEGDDPEHPAGRIRDTRKLLTSAALIMSFYLITTSFVTVVLIPAQEFESGGSANGRALAYLAHEHLGSVFGTVYDLSTIAILAFAGVSAMAGLLNVVPRYLPRYGMAPEWGRAVRPLVLIFTAIAFAITIIFGANVDAQGGAYATGVLVIMTSAAFAVTLSALWRGNSLTATLAFALVTLIFAYTLVANIIGRPDGIRIASFFIAAIIVVSLVSRVRRSLELRQECIEMDEMARRFMDEASEGDEIHIIAHRRRFGDDPEEYARKLIEQREYNHIPEDVPVLFLEVDVEEASEFEDVLEGVSRSADTRCCAAKARPCHRHRRLPATRARYDRQETALLLRLDPGEPHRVHNAVHTVRRRRHRPGHPRGLEGGRTGPCAATHHPRRRRITRISAMIPSRQLGEYERLGH
jgi:hypothetical protein